MKAKSKTAACFTPHVMMHSIFAFGLGLVVATLVVGSHWELLWIGFAAMVVAIVFDATRKA